MNNVKKVLRPSTFHGGITVGMVQVLENGMGNNMNCEWEVVSDRVDG